MARIPTPRPVLAFAAVALVCAYASPALVQCGAASLWWLQRNQQGPTEVYTMPLERGRCIRRVPFAW